MTSARATWEATHASGVERPGGDGSADPTPPDLLLTALAAAAAAALGAPSSLADRVVAAFLASYRPGTRATYRTSLQAWEAWCAKGDVDVLRAERPHAESWVRQLEADGVPGATIRRHLAAVCGFYQRAGEMRACHHDPTAGVRRPHSRRESPRLGLDGGEARALRCAAQQAGVRDQALVGLLLDCGLRVSEAIAVRAGDLSVIRDYCTVEVVREGGAHRTLPLPPSAAVAVELLLQQRRLQDPSLSAPFLVTSAGTSLTRFEVVRIIRRLARAAGIARDVSPHSLRHTFITLALEAGTSVRDVQKAAGHRDRSTTQRYNRGRQKRR